MLTRKDFEDTGYRWYDSSHTNHKGDGVNGFFQKTFFSKDHRRLYFIEAYEWDWEKIAGDKIRKISYEFEMHSYKKKKFAIQMKVFAIEKDVSIDDIEKFYSNCFRKLKFEAYEKFEEDK